MPASSADQMVTVIAWMTDMDLLLIVELTHTATGCHKMDVQFTCYAHTSMHVLFNDNCLPDTDEAEVIT